MYDVLDRPVETPCEELVNVSTHGMPTRLHVSYLGHLDHITLCRPSGKHPSLINTHAVKVRVPQGPLAKLSPQALVL